MVRGLVEHEHVPIAAQKARKVHAPTLSARQVAHAPVPVDVGQKPRDDLARSHIARPHILGLIADDGALDRRVVVEPVGLPEHAHAHAARAYHAPLVGFDQPRHQPQQRGLPVAVATDHADARAFVDAERDALEHRLRGGNRG